MIIHPAGLLQLHSQTCEFASLASRGFAIIHAGAIGGFGVTFGGAFEGES